MRGTITVDGYPKDQATFNRISGYVEQVKDKPISVSSWMTNIGMFACHMGRSQFLAMPSGSPVIALQ